MISLKHLSSFANASGKLLQHHPSVVTLAGVQQISSKCGRRNVSSSSSKSTTPAVVVSPQMFSQQQICNRGKRLASTSMQREEVVPITTLLAKSSKKPVNRGDFSRLDPNDISYFSALLGKHRVLTDESEIEGYNTDWLRPVKGQSRLVLRPKTTQEVSMIMAYCNERNLAVVPQGGNTSCSGGAIAVHDEIVMNTSLMNEIEHVDEWSGVLVCQSGCVLEKLNEHLSQYDLIVPLDLGAKESCQIGGNVSTNAGGLRVIRYGSLHSSVVGVEAVLSDGTVLDLMNTLRKDNTGYHLQHLFIGSEGTLGIVTKVAIQCPPKPKAVNLAFLALDSYKNVLETFRMAKRDLGEILSACEYSDAETMVAVEQNIGLKSPVEKSYPFYMMIEVSGSNGRHDEEKLSMFVENAMDKQIVSDGTIASQPSHIKSLWSIRERFPEALQKDGHLVVYDFSLPLEHFDEMVQETREFLGPLARRVTGFGHLGDGNLHLNLTMDEYSPDALAKVEPFVYNYVAQRKGSVSAEHGLGSIKRDYIYHSKSPQAVYYMRELKKLLDPKGILNPYKVVPERHN